MKAEEKREQFRSELMALLKKYNVSIELQDFGRAYSTHEKMVAVFAFDSERFGALRSSP